MVIVWMTLGVLVCLACLLLYLGLFQDRSRGRPRCPKCWYNMTGAPSLVCPECGHNARNPKRLHRTRRRRWAIVSAAVLPICGYCCWLISVRMIELKEPFHTAVRPTCYLLATLSKAQPAQFDLVEQRIRRFGLWPWEERLLLGDLEAMVSLTSPTPSEAISLLAAGARTSPRVLDRLFELRKDRDPNLRHLALELCAFQARRLRDDQLAEWLDLARSVFFEPYFQADPFDPVLLEMVRRRAPAFRSQIARWVADPPLRPGDVILTTQEDPEAPPLPEGLGKMAFSKASPPPDDSLWSPPASKTYRYEIPANLQAATALRRMDGKPDPLRVSVADPRVIECPEAKLPTVAVSIRNLDADRKAVGFQAGGDDFTGRRARWRFEVRDEQGRLMPVRIPAVRGSGGFTQYTTLKHGQTYETDLDMNKYVHPLPPGRYRVVVMYHNSFTIADVEDISDRIVFSSDPFELIVKPAPAGSRPAGEGTSNDTPDGRGFAR